MRRQTKKSRLLLGVTSVILATAPFFPSAEAATVKSTSPAITAVSKVVSPVYLNAKSYINLVDVAIETTIDDGLIKFNDSSERLRVFDEKKSEIKHNNNGFSFKNEDGDIYDLESMTVEIFNNELSGFAGFKKAEAFEDIKRFFSVGTD